MAGRRKVLFLHVGVATDILLDDEVEVDPTNLKVQ